MTLPSDGTTIVAVATPPGVGGLACVRLSGPDALAIAGRVFRAADPGVKWVSHRAVYGILFQPGSQQPDENEPVEVVDQVLALPFRAPRSYTGEDTVEFTCHGGNVVAGLVVEACLAAGARPAPAGEFTRRAFLNGKLSLDQAEAVADLIHAESRLAARAAVRQVLGGLDRQLDGIEAPLLALLAELEGALEFAEEESVGPSRDEILARLDTAAGAIDSLRRIGRAGRLLRDGIQVALVGEPNVGKSSLLNSLAGDDRAIVDDEPGTTRDVVTARLVRDDRVFVFHDTAGLRAQAGRIERKGIERTARAVAEADLVLHLVEADALDGSFPDLLIDAPESAPESPDGSAPRIAVATKTDLIEGTPGLPPGAVGISNRDGSGLDDLWRRIDEAVAEFQLHEATELGVLLNRRHLARLSECRDEIGQLREMVRAETPGDEVTATLLASITAQLGEVSGRVFSEAVLGEVFSRFCVGK